MLLTSCVGGGDKSQGGRGELMVKEADVSAGRRREDDLSIQLSRIGNLDNWDDWCTDSYVEMEVRNFVR